jgi:endonuclease YncB( thermonuclease family)
VVEITDGDTIRVLRDGRAVVRLQGIDAPEKGQAFGERAKQFTSAAAFDQVVTVRDLGRDRAGRRTERETSQVGLTDANDL